MCAATIFEGLGVHALQPICLPMKWMNLLQNMYVLFLGHVWDQLHPLERNKIVQILVDVVWVRHDGLEVHFHEHGLATLLCDEPIQTLNRKQDIFR